MDNDNANPVRIGIIGDGFMKPFYFKEALETEMPGRAFVIETMELGWPIERNITKVDPTLPVGEFVGRPEQFYDFISGCEILICHLAPVIRDTFEASPDLKFIAVSRGGPINIDMAAAKDFGVKVSNSPGRNASAVAEFAMASMLAEIRNLTRGHVALMNGDYRGDLYHEEITGRELCEMTVGVIGYGEVGSRVVKMLRPFGCKIIVCDPYKQLTRDDADDGVTTSDLDTLLAQSDVVTLHPRVTTETRGMMSAEKFALMKDGSYFVNTARGPLVDYNALYDALTSGKLRGCALDTFEKEPPPADWPLLKLQNVTLSPHIAGASRFTIRKAASQIAGDVRRFLDKEALRYPCN